MRALFYRRGIKALCHQLLEFHASARRIRYPCRPRWGGLQTDPA